MQCVVELSCLRPTAFSIPSRSPVEARMRLPQRVTLLATLLMGQLRVLHMRMLQVVLLLYHSYAALIMLPYLSCVQVPGGGLSPNAAVGGRRHPRRSPRRVVDLEHDVAMPRPGPRDQADAAMREGDDYSDDDLLRQLEDVSAEWLAVSPHVHMLLFCYSAIPLCIPSFVNQRDTSLPHLQVMVPEDIAAGPVHLGNLQVGLRQQQHAQQLRRLRRNNALPPPVAAPPQPDSDDGAIDFLGSPLPSGSDDGAIDFIGSPQPSGSDGAMHIAGSPPATDAEGSPPPQQVCVATYVGLLPS